MSRQVFKALVGVLASSALLVSCSATPNMSQSAPSGEAKLQGSAPANADAIAPASEAAPARKPQLIRRAELSLVVDTIQDAKSEVETLLQQNQGDLLQFQSSRPTAPGSRQTAVLIVRIPQAQLDAVLAKLVELGTVKRQLITAEDVSDQLVDLDARLRNLRRTEQSLLDILQRSGSVGDVLKVTQELSNVRQTIEQIDAQLTNLKNQVAFSTITLELEEARSATPPVTQSVPLQLRETWNDATRTMGEFSLGLVKTVIWLAVYAPYLAVFGGLSVWLWSRNRRSRSAEPTTPKVESLE